MKTIDLLQLKDFKAKQRKVLSDSYRFDLASKCKTKHIQWWLKGRIKEMGFPVKSNFYCVIEGGKPCVEVSTGWLRSHRLLELRLGAPIDARQALHHNYIKDNRNGFMNLIDKDTKKIVFSGSTRWGAFNWEDLALKKLKLKTTPHLSIIANKLEIRLAMGVKGLMVTPALDNPRERKFVNVNKWVKELCDQLTAEVRALEAEAKAKLQAVYDARTTDYAVHKLTKDLYFYPNGAVFKQPSGIFADDGATIDEDGVDYPF